MEQDELVAHELYRAMRQRYELDMREEKGEGAEERGPRSEAPWDAIRKRFFEPKPKT